MVEATKASDHPHNALPSHGKRLRGETVLWEMTGLMLVVVGAMVCWVVHSQSQLATQRRVEQVRAVGQMLSRSAEALLLSENVSQLRQLVVTVSQQHAFESCRVALHDGQIIADSDIDRLPTDGLPAVWPQGPADQGPAVGTEVQGSGQIQLYHPLTVLGRGQATLEIIAPIQSSAGLDGPMLVGILVIGSLGVGVLLAGYLLVRPGLKAMKSVRGALLTYHGPDTPIDLMRINPRFGEEAAAWNSVLDEIDAIRSGQMGQQAQLMLGSARHGSSGLDEACNAMPQGIILLDEQARVRYANGAAAILIGANHQEMVGDGIDRFVSHPAVLDAVRVAADDMSRQRSMLEAESDGDHGPTVLRYSIRPVRRSDSASVMIMIEDITQQRVAERSRHEFVAQVAHELRSPLSNIQLYIETLLEDDLDPQHRSQSINVINSETHRLTRVVNDMLSVAEIEAGSMELRRDDLRLEAIFEALKADYQPRAAEKQIDLFFRLPPKVPVIQADREKFLMAVHNLLGNAVKYTPEGGRVSLSGQVNGNQLILEFSDTGIGIADQEKQKVFEKFYRARDEKITGIPGTGLGLPLAREVVRLHGGDITVESQPGRGSTFTLTLPILAEAA